MNERDFYAETYDASVSGWDGEIDFYQELAGERLARCASITCSVSRWNIYWGGPQGSVWRLPSTELTNDSSETIWVAGRSVGQDNGSIHGGMSRSL